MRYITKKDLPITTSDSETSSDPRFGTKFADQPFIQFTSVGKSYSSSPPVFALREVDLNISTGDYLAVVGPSGSGKSTLLNLLGCLDRPTSGSYLFEGTEVTNLDEGQLAALRGNRIGFVFQAFHLIAHRSAIENVMLAEVYGTRSSSGRRERAVEALQKTGLGHRLNFKPNLLSGGERQRVALARAIVSEPPLLLCDEPTGNLDAANTAEILDLFDDMRNGGLTIVVVTHDPNVSQRADRRVQIVDGYLTEPDTGNAHAT